MLEPHSESTTLPPILAQYIPWDKSWIMRMGLLDLLHGFTNTEDFLAANSDTLSDDLKALATANRQWREGTAIEVGESGTLYRFLQYAAWQTRQPKTFIKNGTLQTRAITNDPHIVEKSLAELLQLDGGTSQWASAAVLLGNTENKPDPLPYKLQVTYEALEHWSAERSKGEPWQPRKDETIMKQAGAYVTWLKRGVMQFKPHQAEDYCFARAFELMTPTEGEARWPSLRQHESDRIASMEEALKEKRVLSKDHRVVQAVALKKGESVTFTNPQVVSKSWPQFWLFLKKAQLTVKV